MKVSVIVTPQTMKPLSNYGSRSLFDARRTVTLWVTVLLLALILIYGYSRTKDILSGPLIELSYPKENSTVHDPLLTVIGKGENISSLTLNGATIHTNESGYFKEKLLLPYGLSILELVATDRFNRKTTKTITLVYK